MSSARTKNGHLLALLAAAVAIAVALPARADNDPSKLSDYGKAVFNAIPDGYPLKADGVLSYGNKLAADWLVLSPGTDVARPPAASTWGVFNLAPNHSDAIPARIKSIMTGAGQWVDILTLGGGDSPGEKFKDALLQALGALNQKADPVTVRILIGAVSKGDNLTEQFVALVRAAVAGYQKAKIYVGIHRSQEFVWNHAKIVAADGRIVMTGGHNMSLDYLKNPTYHDVSMVFEGPGAHQAHLYANRMWDEVCTAGGAAPALTYNAQKSQFVGKVFSNAGQTCPPAYALAAPAAPAGGSIPLIAVSRDSPGLAHLASNVRGSEAFPHLNDAQFAAMIDSAKKSLFISQKQIGPWLLPGDTGGKKRWWAEKLAGEGRFETKLHASEKGNKEVQSEHFAIGGWPYLDHLARAVLRGVKVYLVLHNRKPNWTLLETAQRIGGRVRELFKARGGTVVNGDVTGHLCKYLHIAPFTRGDPSTLPKGYAVGWNPMSQKPEDFSGNHAKVMVVDQEAFYVGSQNLYHSPLPEFGFFVDDAPTTRKFLTAYWRPLWGYAKALAVTGGTSKERCIFKQTDELMAQSGGALDCASLAAQASDPTAATKLLACLTRLAESPQLSTPAHGLDRNFGCTLTAADLTDWPVRGWKGQNPYLREHVKLWRSIDGKGLAPKDLAKCKHFPDPAAFIKPVDKGGVQRADLVVLTEDIPVVRAFSPAPFACSEKNPAGKVGSWWSFTDPSNKAIYRTDTAVCDSWNDFSRKHTCTLKKGTVVAVGPTQSYRGCAHGPNDCAGPKPAWPTLYPAADAHQVFLNTFKRSKAELDAFLTDCREDPWP